MDVDEKLGKKNIVSEFQALDVSFVLECGEQRNFGCEMIHLCLSGLRYLASSQRVHNCGRVSYCNLTQAVYPSV